MRKVLAATLALSMIAACGGSEAESERSATDSPSALPAPGEGDQPSPTDAPSESTAGGESDKPETDAPAQDLAADVAAAEAALLTLSDFPAGWSEVPSEDDSDSELDDRVQECFGQDAVGLFNDETGAETGDFTDPADDSTVNHTVNLAATVESAEAFIAAGSADGVTECLTSVYRDEFPRLLAEDGDMDGVELGEITVGNLNVGEIGEDGFAYRVTVPISVEGFSIDVAADLVVVRIGRAASVLAFTSFFAPTPIERITEYTTLAISRLPG